MVEYAWVVQYMPGIEWKTLKTYIDVPMLHAGCFPGERLTQNGRSLHPTQKPVAVMKHFLCPGIETVCDPYMGTGTMGLACLQTRRRFVGIEIEARWFDLACRRLEDALRQGDLFCHSIATPALAPRQEGLFDVR
jgi:DNA modification methylase